MTASAEVSSQLGVRDLLNAGLHFGHQTKRWNPKMKRYIFDKRNGIHVLDLSKSLKLLENARKMIYELVTSGRKILFVGTKKQAQRVIEEAAVRTGQHYVVTRWLGGTLTNNETIRRSIKRMRELEKMDAENSYVSMSKKEISRLRHEMSKLKRNLSGIANMDELPSAVFVVDTCREAIAIKEANTLHVPVIAMVDTNSDPDPIDYPIPANDDAIRSIRLVVNAIAETIVQANGEYSVKAAELARQQAASGGTAAAPTSDAKRRAAKPHATRRKPGARKPGAHAGGPGRPGIKSRGTHGGGRSGSGEKGAHGARHAAPREKPAAAPETPAAQPVAAEGDVKEAPKQE